MRCREIRDIDRYVYEYDVADGKSWICDADGTLQGYIERHRVRYTGRVVEVAVKLKDWMKG